MKIVIRVLITVTVVVATWFVFLVLDGGDVVENNYATLAEAKADRLFERGWLPEALPPSTRDIRISNDLDVVTSVGHFTFSGSEWPLFASQTQAAAVSPGVNERMKRGFAARAFSEAGSTWLFFCKPESVYCEYVLRTQRGQ